MSEPDNHAPIGPESAAPIAEMELQRYMDGRLEPAQQRELEARLKASPAGRRTLDAMREEAKLLRNALERLSEPPTRVAERVVAAIYADFNRRQAFLRARLWRRRVIATVAAAAALMLAVWLIKPREPSGQVASGSGVARLQTDGTLLALEENGSFYENDTLVTGRGQFARLRLAEGSVVDLDENSKLVVEEIRNGAATLRLIEGRACFETGHANLGFLVKTGPGHIRADPEAVFEIWLAHKVPAHPAAAWAGPWALRDEAGAGDEKRPVCLTVLDGTVYVHTNTNVRGSPVSQVRRVIFGAGHALGGGEKIHDVSHMDERREEWAATRGEGPKDRALLGLLPDFEWNELARRFDLTERLPGGATTLEAMRSALGELEGSRTAARPDMRAAFLSRGQQALRAIAQGFPLTYFEGRRRIRVLEGLAHFERGRALWAIGDKSALAGARSAFMAAGVSFQEALSGGQALPDAGEPKASLADLKLAPKVLPSSKLNEFLPDEQALLFARFYRAWSAYHLRRLEQQAGETRSPADADVPGLFAEAGELLGRSVEGLGAHYGRALALAQAGRDEEAFAAFQEVTDTSLAGTLPEPRAWSEGIRQAALVDSAALAARTRRPAALQRAVDAFRVRYPLDGERASARAIGQAEFEYILGEARRAIHELRHADAVRALDAAFQREAQAGRLAPAEMWKLRLDRLEALIGAGDARRAERDARILESEPAPVADEILRTRAETLIEKAKLLRERLNEEEAREPAAIELNLDN